MFGAVGAIVAAIQQKRIIKGVQSGITAGAGNVTINSVDTTKAVVLSASKGSAGTVAATGNITLTPSGGSVASPGDPYQYVGSGSFPTYSGSMSGGTTNLTVKVYSAKLVNPTTIYCDGPVEWQVIEYA
jgi:hypothetical protein